MIKVALPNKGMLFEPTQELLKACGYKASKPYKTLTQLDTKNGIEFFFLRPSDIPMYVGRGIIDAGITGIDKPDMEKALLEWETDLIKKAD